MILELRIQNYAIIEQLSVRLENGLNVLTGETGAGKSIIVGALSLLLGERATADVVRAGAQRAAVEGVFDVASDDEITSLLHEQGIEADDGLLILRREVAVEGRNRAWVNGAASTSSFVGRLGRLLIDLHGQHESQTLLAHDAQRDILDAFAEAEAVAQRVADAHARLASARRSLEDLDQRRREAEQRADYLRFQDEEISSARIQPGEDERLEEEARRLEHAEELQRLARQLHTGLYAGEHSITTRLSELRRQLAQLTRIDASQQDLVEPLESALYALEEVGRRFGEYGESVEHDPRRLDAVRQRQDLLYRLKSKYGPTLDDVRATAQRAREELDLLDQAGFDRKQLEQTLTEAADALNMAASQLSQLRRKAARRLEKEVAKVLPEVALNGATFEVALLPRDSVGANGAEDVEFRIAVNAGFEPRPLARVASGGELSRVMLALKTILAREDRVPTLVFDEIDVGIGGRTAHRIAEKLHEVARHHQVFVITHLAQIAARADNQLLVEKIEREGSTITRVQPLTGDERVEELARMLSGDPESDASIEHARELLGRGAKA